MSEWLRVRELAAWGFDASPYRPRFDGAVARGMSAFAGDDCLVEVGDEALRALFGEQAGRSDLLEEMQGLDWSLGIVDLRGLIAFQRRVVFDPERPYKVSVEAGDWRGLFGVAFGPPVAPVYRQSMGADGAIVIETDNPNLQLRRSEGVFALHGGSPFFEVATYRGRWFLRDGYHRAYALLRAGVVHVPAVVVRARTLAELGPVGEWFFAEEILFGERPPLVRDFLDDTLTVEYTRPRMMKTIRVRVEESFVAVVEDAGNDGKEYLSG